MSLRQKLYDLATDKTRGFLPSVLKSVLLLFSFLYGFIIRLLIFLRGLSRVRLPCRVVSVGNITLGGTGKTLLVEEIAAYLENKGHKVAILTRGYKRQAALPAQKSQGNIGTDYRNMGDEAYMLSVNLKDTPVIVDADRVRGAGIAFKKFGVDTVVLDDGFQQWHIKKDLEIVTIDSASVFGNRHMLPRGILREPLSSLKRADVFVLTNCRHNESENRRTIGSLSAINPFAFVIQTEHSPVCFYALGKKERVFPLSFLKDRTVALVCAIGNPESFKNSVEDLEARVGFFKTFEDHHDYTQKEWDLIAGSLKDSGIDAVVTTEKDAARLSRLEMKKYGIDVLVLKVKMGFKEDGQRLYNRLLGIYTS